MPRIAYSDGPVADELRALVLFQPVTKARQLHHSVACGLEKLGYKVKREHIVPNRGDGHRGKIDIIARRGLEVIAMELDCHTPRKKSLFKLSNFAEATLRIVVTRY